MKRSKEKDITVYDLPKNRWEVFLECYKQRFLLVLLLGAIVLLSFLPLLVATFFKDNADMTVYLDFSDGIMDEEGAAAAVRSNAFWFSLINIPCYVVLSLGLAGVANVIRRLIFGEPVFFTEDFFGGIKSCGGCFSALAFFGGVIAFLLSSATAYDQTTQFLLTVVKIAGVVLLAPIAFFTAAQALIYNNTFFGKAKNSVIFFLRSVPTTLILLAAFALSFAITFVPVYVVRYVLFIVTALFYAPPLIIGWLLYSCYIFDKFMNKEHYPDLFDRGVYRAGIKKD